MNYVFRLSAVLAIVLLGLNIASAQEESSNKGQVDAEKIRALAEANAKHAEQIEAWAEKHSKEWESWAERFESKMEHWAESQEKHMDKWGESYAKRWEDWAAKMESGEFDADEMNALMEQNLKMIKEMPLAELLETGLHEGLQELKNAPFDNLGELHDLIGGSLEKSLRSMEKELQKKIPETYSKAIKEMKTKDLHKALQKLQQSLDAKNASLDKNAAEKLLSLKNLMKLKDKLDPENESRAVEAIEREIVDAKIARKALYGKKSAIAAAQKMELEKYYAEAANLAAQKSKHLNEAMHDKLKAIEASKKAIQDSKKGLSLYYSNLVKQKAKLNSKENEIDTMRREIEMLRKEFRALKKQRGK